MFLVTEAEVKKGILSVGKDEVDEHALCFARKIKNIDMNSAIACEFWPCNYGIAIRYNKLLSKLVSN